MSSIKRREFITLLGAAAWPFAARAQQATRVPRIGIIDDSPAWDPFRQGLRDVGYQEGQNIAFEYRYANGLPTRLAEAAAELVDRRVDLIATFGTPQTQAAKQGDDDDSHRHDRNWRPGGGRTRSEHQQAWRQHHREHHPWPGRGWQTAAAPQGGCPLRFTGGPSLESG